MNKTLYIRDEDAAIWDRAREVADDKLSPVIVAALKSLVAEREAAMGGMERIELRYCDATKSGRPAAKAFYGKWLITPKEPFRGQTATPRTVPFAYAVAVTAKHSVVTFAFQGSGVMPWAAFSIYPSFDAAFQVVGQTINQDQRAALAEALYRQGLVFEELDI